MNCGRRASSRSACRSSWIQEVSAASLTAVPAHTAQKSCSLVTTCPAREASSQRRLSAFGLIRSSSLLHRSPWVRSTTKGPKRIPELSSLGLKPPMELPRKPHGFPETRKLDELYHLRTSTRFSGGEKKPNARPV